MRLDAPQPGHVGLLELFERGALPDEQLQRATNEVGRPGQDPRKGAGVGRRNATLQRLAEVCPKFFQTLHRLGHNLRKRLRLL
jgi:hypothetical protein